MLGQVLVKVAQVDGPFVLVLHGRRLSRKVWMRRSVGADWTHWLHRFPIDQTGDRIAGMRNGGHAGLVGSVVVE